MSNPTQSQIALMYFQSFCKKDTASLEVLFSDSIVLTDWEVQVVGKDNILKFNQNFFNSVKDIRIDASLNLSNKVDLSQNLGHFKDLIVFEKNKLKNWLNRHQYQ